MRSYIHIGFFACLLVMFFISLGISPVEAKPDDDWQMFGHDSQHTWYTSDSGPSDNSLNWSKAGVFRGPPAVVGGKVYISDDTDIRCLDASTGENIWIYETEYAIESSPAVVGGKVYVGSVDKNLYCLDASTGENLWSFEADGWVNSSPTVAGGKVYFITHVNTLYCLNASTGESIWSRQDFTFRFPPSISDGKAYVGTADNYLLCLDASTGTDVWSHPTEGYVVSAPAVAGGKVYFSTNILSGQAIIGARVYSLDASSGAESWKKSMSSGLSSSPAVKGSRLYVGSQDQDLYCLNASNGEVSWSYDTVGPVSFCPAVASTRLYFGDDKTVYCLNASTGELVWTDYYNMASSPVVVGGRLYIVTPDHIYSLGQVQEEIPEGGAEEVSLLERPETLLVVGVAVIGIIGVALYWLGFKRKKPVKKELRW